MSRTRWIAGIVIVLVVACSGGGARRASSDSPTVVEVQNDANLDMTIYVTAQVGSRNRLGLAIAHRTSWFTIPQRLIFGLTPLQFQADPVGTGALPVSQEITVEPGDTVVLRTPPGS